MSDSANSTHTTAQRRILDAMLGADQQPATRADVQELRDEVAALRAALVPSASPIIHGAQALREFAALRTK